MSPHCSVFLQTCNHNMTARTRRLLLGGSFGTERNSSPGRKPPETLQIKEEPKSSLSNDEAERLEEPRVDMLATFSVVSQEDTKPQHLSSRSHSGKCQDQGDKSGKCLESTNSAGKKQKNKYPKSHTKGTKSNPTSLETDNGNNRKSLQCGTCGRDFKRRANL